MQGWCCLALWVADVQREMMAATYLQTFWLVWVCRLVESLLQLLEACIATTLSHWHSQPKAGREVSPAHRGKGRTLPWLYVVQPLGMAFYYRYLKESLNI